jgi:hypothetical protein
MRLSTAGWFATGCGLAVVALGVVAVGHVAVNVARSEANTQDAQGLADGTLDALTPAVDPASSDDVAVIAPHAAPDWLDVPLQRPRTLRDTPSVAPPPPIPELGTDDAASVGGARLPSPEATLYWDPDDARMPERTTVVARAYWNPDSATLPRAKETRRVVWDPDDARLP